MISATRGLSASTSERAVGGANSSEMDQLFPPLAGLSHHLHYFNNGLLTRRAPSHHDGLLTRRAPSHHDGLLTRRAPSHHDDLLTPHCTTSLTATAIGLYYDCVGLPAARFARKTRPFRALRSFWMGHIRCAFGMADWLNRLRAFIIYIMFLIKKKKCKTNIGMLCCIVGSASWLSLRAKDRIQNQE